MEIKNLTERRFKFWAWDNLDYPSGIKPTPYIRAVALCEDENGEAGYFKTAINAVRDSSMGEKDEAGVYDRLWRGDFIECDEDARDIRPATDFEVLQYISHVTFEEALPIDEDEIISIEITENKGHIEIIVLSKNLKMEKWTNFWNKPLDEKAILF